MESVNNELEARMEKDLDERTKFKIIREFVEKYPNDDKLGGKVREYILKLKLKKNGK